MKKEVKMKPVISFFAKVTVLCFIFIVLCTDAANALTVAKSLVTVNDFGSDLSAGISWSTFNGTYTIENGWVKLVNTLPGQNSACKTIVLNQTAPKMIRLTGQSKAENVSGTSGLSYSLRYDVTYMDDSMEKYNCFPFTTGTHDWESADGIFYPKKAVKNVCVIVMLYNVTGTVWFNNVTFQEQSSPGTFAKFDDTGILNQTSAEGYLVRQFTDGEDWYEISSGQSGNNWGLVATSDSTGGTTVHTATLTNYSGAERAGVLAYRIPLGGSGFKWCEADLRTETATDNISFEFKNEIDINWLKNSKPRSKFLWGCVVNSTTGYAIAIDPDYPVQFRIRYESNSKELFVVFDLGFSSDVSSATVKFLTWTFTPASGAGMRQAISSFYKNYPDAFRDRFVTNGQEHGIWLINDLTAGNAITNISDFGFKLNQQQYGAASIAYDDANSILDTAYVHPTELFIDIADLGAGPTYEQVIAKLNQLAGQGSTTALAIQNSAVKDKNGKYIYHTGSLWSPNYARFVMNPAPNVGLPGRNSYYDQWTSSAIQNYLNPGTMDGIMCDNAEAQYWDNSCAENTRIDYAATHFSAMQTPLVHDKNGNIGICYEMMIWEYFNGMRDDIFAGSRFLVMQANGVPYCTTFISTKLDVTGGEQTWDYSSGWHPQPESNMLLYRAQSGRKLVTFLQELENIANWTNARTQKYFARCCAFGIMPSFYLGGYDPNSTQYFEDPNYYERDRNIFKTYIPVIRKLSQAGWEPVREATVNDSEVFLERFGAEYITVFNPSANSKNVTVTYLPSVINMTGRELISGNNVTWINSQATVTVDSECVAVLEIPALINFSFEEGAGTSVAAQAPYNSLINGTLSAGVGWTGTEGGISGNALNFNGSSGYVQIPDNAIFDMGDNGLTYSAWIKADTLNSSGHSMVMCKGGGQYMSIVSKYLFFKLTTAGTQQRYCQGSTQLQTNTWYHVAATCDREGYMKVFINGRQNGSTAGPFLNPVNNTSYMRIGDFVGSGWFDGVIDDVQICRKGSTDKEIRKLKDRAIIAYSLPLDEGTGSAAYDNFDSTRQAVITGGTWHGNVTLDKQDNALYFDGVNDYVTIAGSSTGFRTDGSNGFTLAAWIKADGAFPAAHDPVISRGNTYLSIYNGKLGFKTLTDYPANNQRWCAGSTALTSGVWHHVAAVYEANGNMKVYLDGVQNGSTVGPYPNQANEASNIQIGAWNSYFKGIISNARIYKRGLTADEINLLYQNKE
jgi:hypothetical protein